MFLLRTSEDLRRQRTIEGKNESWFWEDIAEGDLGRDFFSVDAKKINEIDPAALSGCEPREQILHWTFKFYHEECLIFIGLIINLRI